MTPDEAKAVLAAARDSAAVHQWNDVDHLLRPVHDQGVLTGADQGDAAYLIGLAYFHLGWLDAAEIWLTDASSTAGADNQTHAKQYLGELRRNSQATVAEILDGDVDKTEAATVLAAADDALRDGDLDRAKAHYLAVYDGHADDAPRAMAALGIATVLAHGGDLTQATEYANYVLGRGLPDSTPGAQALLGWIKQQQTATTAMADGATVDEYTQTNQAAMQARDNGNPEHARTLWLTLLDSPQLASAERAVVAFNLGLAEAMLGMWAEARPHFEFAAAHGTAQAVQLGQEALAAMDRHETAEALVARFQ